MCECVATVSHESQGPDYSEVLPADSQSCSANTRWESLNKTHSLPLGCQAE